MYNLMNHRLHLPHPIQILSVLSVAALLAGCKTAPQPGTFATRRGDEIVIAGQFVHTGTRVVLWMDPGGYDAYRVERRFSPIDKADWGSSQEEVRGLRSPNRYNMRGGNLTNEEIERARGGGWERRAGVNGGRAD